MVKSFDEIITSLSAGFLINYNDDWTFVGLDFEGDFILSFGLLLRFRGLLLNFFDSLFKRLECVNCESNFLALDFSRFQNKVPHLAEIALNIMSIAKAMPSPSAPKTYIRLKASTYGLADCTVSAGVVCALPPLVIKF
jgi:hypothetical protein